MVSGYFINVAIELRMGILAVHLPQGDILIIIIGKLAEWPSTKALPFINDITK